MSLLKPYSTVVYAVCLGVTLTALVWGYHRVKESGADEVRAEQAKERIQALEDNSRREAQLQFEQMLATEDKDAKLRTVNSRLTAALGELRNRPERHSDLSSGTPSCQGASGSELSGPDAGFLAWFASEAAARAAERDECYRKYDAVKAAQPPGKTAPGGPSFPPGLPPVSP